MKKNYIIPFGERFTAISSGAQTKYVEVDLLGIRVQYSKGEEDKLTPENIRRYLIGVNEQGTVCIQAEDLRDALKQFHELPGAQIGFKHKAIWVCDSERTPIIEYSGCEHMIVKGWFACGAFCETDEEREKESMVCVIDGLDDPPSFCPIHQQQLEMKFRSEIVQIGGYWLKRYSDKVKEMKPFIPGNTMFKRAKSMEKAD